MKRNFAHPPREERPKMWRSLNELEGNPEFDQWLEREFPPGADVYQDSGLSRRDFVKLLGASMALAGVGLTGCRRPESYLVPFTKAVEFTIPGKNLYYATSMPTRLGAMPLLATTVDGRPIKIEGNPVHPNSNGSTNAFAQASVLDLYDPHRSKEILHQGESKTREEFDAALAAIREKYQGNGTGLAFLAEENNSPTREKFRQALAAEFPGMIWAEYEPLGHSLATQAVEAAFGPGAKLVPQLTEADVLLALDSDFLNASVVGINFADGFFPRRSPDQTDRGMNRLYAVESAYSLTGGMADHRLPLKSSRIGAFTHALAREIAAANGDSSLAALAAGETPADLAPHADWIRECAADLVAHRGQAVVFCGFQQPYDVQLLTLAINQSLGAFDQVLQVRQAPPRTGVSNIDDLMVAVATNSVDTLFILGGNPAYNAPADLEFAEKMKGIANTIRLSMIEDETSKLAAWQVPAAHYLESWGDGRSLDGTVTPVQPMILPLWNGVPELEILNTLLGRETPEGPALIRETFEALSGVSGEAANLPWTEYLRSGFLADSAYPASSSSWNGAQVASELRAMPNPAGAVGAELELVFLPSSSLDDGRYASNSWLLENPDFVTKLVWDNALLVSLADLKKLDARDGDFMEVSANGKTLEVAVIAAPGQAEGSFGLALGYGHRDITALMDNVGFDAYPLRTSDSPRFAANVQIKPLQRKYTFARTQEHNSMEGRDLFREGTIERYQRQPDFPQKMGEFADLTPLVQAGHQLFTNDFLTAKEQWAMAVDLNVCTGCNACLIACRSENNVPVVGKDQVNRGRDMAWIRMDRWFAGEPENPEMLSQVITCQQCENAPCETVCPVNATVHSEDGLNLMAYNRCIGTRYCANNCPWKVRRFNFFDYNERPLDKLYWGPLAPKGMVESVQMVKNPNVTVRMRGVMEKCTFCIQRIEEAKIARLVEAGARNKNEVPIGPFQTACQQACPSDAIVFGDQNDENSLVAKLRKAQRGYTMFGYVNARPRITYLARLKNPNPRMPGAELVGNINASGHEKAEPAEKKEGTASPLSPNFEHIPTGVSHGVEAATS
jgi:MoCo/4Fe-4S cofactor protein with predicted Tat translocation signal